MARSNPVESRVGAGRQQLGQHVQVGENLGAGRETRGHTSSDVSEKGIRLGWGRRIARDSPTGRGGDRAMSVLNSFRWRSGQRKEMQPMGE